MGRIGRMGEDALLAHDSKLITQDFFPDTDPRYQILS
jgi:hypothetical protein